MTGAPPVVRVLVVDDSEEFLAGVGAWIGSQVGLELAGAARSGAQALLVVEELRPDLVLMDAAMPGIDGFEATRRLKARGAMPLVVILTFYDTEVARREAWAAGADGFVAKADVSDQLARIIRELFAERSPHDGLRPDASRPEGEPPSEPTTERRGLAAGELLTSKTRGAAAPRFHGRSIARLVLRAIWGIAED